MTKAWKIVKTFFWVVVIVGSVCIILSSLNFFGNRMYVVKSGSMEPKIHTGSVVIDRKAGSYVVGDIITFKVNDGKTTVTHRINKINSDGSFTVKGDANKTADPDPVQQSNVVGKEVFTTPYIGYFLAFLRTLPGLIIFIFVPAVIIISDEIANIKSEVARLSAAKKKSAVKPIVPEDTVNEGTPAIADHKNLAPKQEPKPNKIIHRIGDS